MRILPHFTTGCRVVGHQASIFWPVGQDIFLCAVSTDFGLTKMENILPDGPEK